MPDFNPAHAAFPAWVPRGFGRLPMNTAPVLPIGLDLAAVFLFALTGAWAAVKRDYDFVGVTALAFVVGVGGGLIRDGVFLQQGAPAAVQDVRYLWAVLAATVVGVLLHPVAGRLDRFIAVVDAAGLGAYAVVGVQKSLAAGIPLAGAVLVGVVNAVGGGLIRDVLVREEPLFFKPGQFYALAALAGCIIFVSLLEFAQLRFEYAAWSAIAATFVFRMLAIEFNWRTGPVRRWDWRRRSGDKEPD
jgi:uncharacterized membrane protein YeiH